MGTLDYIKEVIKMKKKDIIPTKAPLKKIVCVDKAKTDKFSFYKSVILDCGHSCLVPKTATSRKTRCYDCLSNEINVWKEKHTCVHGNIVTEEHECSDCAVVALEQKIQKALNMARNISHGTETRLENIIKILEGE